MDTESEVSVIAANKITGSNGLKLLLTHGSRAYKTIEGRACAAHAQQTWKVISQKTSLRQVAAPPWANRPDANWSGRSVLPTFLPGGSAA